MKMAYCAVCQAPRGFKRHLGVGTLLGLFFTGGLLLFLLPFYPKRCIICGTDESDSRAMASPNAVQVGRPVSKGIGGTVVVVFIVIAVLMGIAILNAIVGSR